MLSSRMIELQRRWSVKEYPSWNGQQYKPAEVGEDECVLKPALLARNLTLNSAPYYRRIFGPHRGLLPKWNIAVKHIY